jgi:hypothetical protein
VWTNGEGVSIKLSHSGIGDLKSDITGLVARFYLGDNRISIEKMQCLAS